MVFMVTSAERRRRFLLSGGILASVFYVAMTLFVGLLWGVVGALLMAHTVFGQFWPPMHQRAVLAAAAVP